MTTDLNHAIRQEALKRALSELNIGEGEIANFPNDLALTTARIVQDLTRDGWKPTTPGGDLWNKVWDAYTCVLEAPANACVDDAGVMDLANRAAVAVLDEFIELQPHALVAPQDAKDAVNYLYDNRTSISLAEDTAIKTLKEFFDG